MAAGLVLHDAAEVIGISVRAYRAAGKGGAIAVHIAYAFVSGCVHKQNHQTLPEVHRGIRLLGPGKGIIRLLAEYPVLGKHCAELAVLDGVDGTNSALVAHCRDCIDIEILLVALVRLKVEEMIVAVGCIGGESTLGYVFGIISFAREDKVNSGALACSLECLHVAVRIVIVVLFHVECEGAVLLVQFESHLTAAALVVLV